MGIKNATQVATNTLNYILRLLHWQSLRILFGALMFASLVRFWANGWIEKLYLEPLFHFSFYGFEWVKPLGIYTYLLFVVCAIKCIIGNGRVVLSMGYSICFSSVLPISS